MNPNRATICQHARQHQTCLPTRAQHGCPQTAETLAAAGPEMHSPAFPARSFWLHESIVTSRQMAESA